MMERWAFRYRAFRHVVPRRRVARGLLRSAAMTSSITLVSDRGAARLRRLSRAVAEVTLSGYGEAALVALVADHLRPWRFEAGQLTLLIDAAELSGYAPEFRREWALWLLNAAEDLAIVYVLGDARAVFTGVPASSIVLSDLVRGLRDRTAYEEKKREAVWDD